MILFYMSLYLNPLFFWRVSSMVQPVAWQHSLCGYEIIPLAFSLSFLK